MIPDDDLLMMILMFVVEKLSKQKEKLCNKTQNLKGQQTSMTDSDVTQIKLVFLGEAGVGKSSIALRFTKDEFNLSSESTIGGPSPQHTKKKKKKRSSSLRCSSCAEWRPEAAPCAMSEGE